MKMKWSRNLSLAKRRGDFRSDWALCFRELSPNFWILSTNFHVLSPNFWILSTNFRVLSPNFWILSTSAFQRAN